MSDNFLILNLPWKRWAILIQRLWVMRDMMKIIISNEYNHEYVNTIDYHDCVFPDCLDSTINSNWIISNFAETIFFWQQLASKWLCFSHLYVDYNYKINIQLINEMLMIKRQNLLIKQFNLNELVLMSNKLKVCIIIR